MTDAAVRRLLVDRAVLEKARANPPTTRFVEDRLVSSVTKSACVMISDVNTDAAVRAISETGNCRDCVEQENKEVRRRKRPTNGRFSQLA